MYELWLISQSPRRHQILTEAGFEVRSTSVKISEIFDKNLNGRAASRTLAVKKLKAFVNSHKSLKGQSILAITADTLVDLEGVVLGKPEGPEEAVKMLAALSAKTHVVTTSVAMRNFSTNVDFVFSDSSQVTFRSLSAQEILDYVNSGEPMDKAGAYGIQGLGGKLVAAVQGSWFNIVGFPLEKFREVLEQKGWQVKSK